MCSILFWVTEEIYASALFSISAVLSQFSVRKFKSQHLSCLCSASFVVGSADSMINFGIPSSNSLVSIPALSSSDNALGAWSIMAAH